MSLTICIAEPAEPEKFSASATFHFSIVSFEFSRNLKKSFHFLDRKSKARKNPRQIMEDSDGNNNLTPPKLLKKKITPPPSPYISRQRSVLTDPISINVTSPNGNLFNFDDVPITPKRVQKLAFSGFVKPKTPKTLGKVKQILKDNEDLLDELIDVKGKLNDSNLKFEALSEKLDDVKREKESLKIKLEIAMKQLEENDEEILALKNQASQKVEMSTLKPNLKRKSVLFNVTSTKKSRKSGKSIKLKMRSSMNLNASLKIKSDNKRGSTVAPNMSKMLAEERAKVEELTRELKKFQGEAKHFKAAPVPTFTENSVKPTRTTLLRQQSLRIKKN